MLVVIQTSGPVDILPAEGCGEAVTVERVAAAPSLPALIDRLLYLERKQTRDAVLARRLAAHPQEAPPIVTEPDEAIWEPKPPECLDMHAACESDSDDDSDLEDTVLIVE